MADHPESSGPESLEPNHLRLRVSDSERHRVAELLSVAVGDGRLTVDEYDGRLRDVWSATTRSQLVPLIRDLVPPQAWQHNPSLGPQRPVEPPSAVGTKRAIAFMSGFHLRGGWRVPASVHALAIMGGGEIDLRSAVFTTAAVEISVLAIMGGVAVIVPPDVSVTTSGMGVMGGFSRTDHIADIPDAPRVHVSGFALMGGVEIKVARADEDPADDEFRRRPS